MTQPKQKTFVDQTQEQALIEVATDLALARQKVAQALQTVMDIDPAMRRHVMDLSFAHIDMGMAFQKLQQYQTQYKSDCLADNVAEMLDYHELKALQWKAVYDAVSKAGEDI